MKFLVTGSSGYLGSHLVEHLRRQGDEIIGIDLSASPTTTHVGSIVDSDFIDSCCQGVDAIFHTASLHKPHIISHTNQAFVDTNVTGTLNLLEAAIKHGIRKLIFTSTTSVFGKALVPTSDHEPTTWITESVIPIPKNVYGITKLCAENLCQLYYDLHRGRFSCLILRTSRFFPEDDDNPDLLASNNISDENMKYNEYLHRRVHLHDVITAHLHAQNAAENIGFGIYIISSTSPFSQTDTNHLRKHTPEIVEKYYPEYREIYERKGWKMNSLDRVYVNEKARSELGWMPEYDFKRMIQDLSIEESDEKEAES